MRTRRSAQPLAGACNLDDPTTWQYQVDPFCEPQQIPGTPNISVGMEQFNDTPIVNGTAYPTTTLDPKSYRFRILNAANDRFWNLSWYVADSTDPGTEVDILEVAASEVAAAQTDINIVPTPDTALSPNGPDWIQIGSEGGFLPAPTVVPAQPTTWITDPTRFDVGNVDKHSLLLAPAERGDVDRRLLASSRARRSSSTTTRPPPSRPASRATTTTPVARTRVPAWSCPATARTRGPSCRSRSQARRPPPRST